MAYCTEDDLVGRFGGKEIMQLSDKGDADGVRTGEIDSDRVQLAIEDASSEIDSYLAACYDVASVHTLVEDESVTIPTLVRLCCDIARYRMYDSLPLNTEASTSEPHRRYKAAINELLSICSIVLLDSNGESVQQVGGSGNMVAVAKSCNLIPNQGCNSGCVCDPDNGLWGSCD